MKTIVFDGQVLQTQAIDRGIGVYLINLIKTVSKKHQIFILVNLKLNKNNSPIKKVFKNSDVVLVDVKLSVPKKGGDFSNKYKKQLNKVIKKKFKHQEVVFILPSIFMFDYFADFPDNCLKCLINHDLTPLILWDKLGKYFPPQFYFSRFRLFYQADQIFNNSKTTLDDLVSIVGINRKKLVNLYGGYSIPSKFIKPKFFNEKEKYILFPTGNMIHKNNQIVVQGFNEFLKTQKDSYKLLVTSFFDDNSKKELIKYSKNIIFTNNLQNAEIDYLYKKVEIVIFGSLYEGLGLPVLEAVYFNKTIVLSDIKVFKEIGGKESFYYFKTNDFHDLAKQLKVANLKKGLANKKKHYPQILKKYNWNQSAKTFNQSISQLKSPTHDIKNGQSPIIQIISCYPTLSNFYLKLETMNGLLYDKFDVYYYFLNNSLKKIPRPSFLEYTNQAQFIDQNVIISSKKATLTVYYFELKDLTSHLLDHIKNNPGLIFITYNGSSLSSKDNQIINNLKNYSKNYYFFDTDKNTNINLNQKLLDLIGKNFN